MDNDTEDQEVNLTIASKLAEISAPTLLYYINKGRGPCYRVIAGRKIFKRKDVLEWKAGHD